LDDYRELAEGFWFPAKQEYRFIDNGDERAPPTSESKLRLVEARVNEPLADNLFTIDMKDGVEVNDLTHDPPLFYKQKANRTPEEWQAIIDEHRRQNDEWKKKNAARDALVGQPAPKLPAGKWLNSPPLDLAALEDKVVILDFWSTSCAPCMNDLPQLISIHNDSSASGVVVIGVHDSGGQEADVAAFAKRWKLTYPIVIDLPVAEGAEAFSQMASQLKVNAIPYTYVIDREGRIAAHGSLREVSGKAFELARQADE
jgi:thiol-disulfide isomerase/thioredoxin